MRRKPDREIRTGYAPCSQRWKIVLPQVQSRVEQQCQVGAIIHHQHRRVLPAKNGDLLQPRMRLPRIKRLVSELQDAGTAAENLPGRLDNINSAPLGSPGMEDRYQTRKLPWAAASTSAGSGLPRRPYRITPSGPIRYTVRLGAKPDALYSLPIFCPSSTSSANGSLYRSRNFVCLALEAGFTPYTTAFFA